MMDGGSLTVVWEEPARHGGSVGHPGSRINGTNRLTFRTQQCYSSSDTSCVCLTCGCQGNRWQTHPSAE